jgi:hypothetical protein
MPNWCDNSLLVEGDEKELERFFEHAKGYGLTWGSDEQIPKDEKHHSLIDFSKFIRPTDAELKRPYGDQEDSYGYEWCNENWGTKWNACDAISTWDEDRYGSGGIDKSEIGYSFNTAWSPMSEQLLRNMEQMFPKLKFHYQFIETGMEFYGCWNTEESRHECYDFPNLESLAEDYIELKSDLYTDSFLEEHYDGDREHMIQDACCDIIGELETMIMDAGDSLKQFTAEDVWNYIEGNEKHARKGN